MKKSEVTEAHGSQTTTRRCRDCRFFFYDYLRQTHAATQFDTYDGYCSARKLPFRDLMLGHGCALACQDFEQKPRGPQEPQNT